MEYSSKAKAPGRQRSQLRHGEPSAEGFSSLALVIGAGRESDQDFDDGKPAIVFSRH